MLSYIQNMLRQEKVFTLSKRKPTIQNGTHRAYIQANALKDLYVSIIYSCEDFCLFNTYSGITSISGGVVTQAFNRAIGSINVLNSTLTYDPTSFVGGNKRGDDFIGASGATAVRAGGSSGGELETIIKAGNDLMIELIRTETGTKYSGIILHMYELG